MVESVLEKLKKIMLVADRMRQDQMRRILGLDDKDFDNALLDWALQFRFRIDGEDVVFAGGDVQGFIGELDQQFKQWNKAVVGKTKDVQVPTFFNPPPLASPPQIITEGSPTQAQQGGTKQPANITRTQSKLLSLLMAAEEEKERKDWERMQEIRLSLEKGDFKIAKSVVHCILLEKGVFSPNLKQTYWDILHAEETACLKRLESSPNKLVLKILLVGESGVGKSAFLRRYLDGGFRTDLLMTRGVDIHIKEVTRNNGDIFCLFYDFGADYKFKEFWQVFVPGAHGAIVMYDITRIHSLDCLEEWVHFCRAKNTALPILLCGTKLDLAEDRSVSVDYAGGFTKSLYLFDLYETSAKSGADVTAAVDALVREILKRVNLT